MGFQERRILRRRSTNGGPTEAHESKQLKGGSNLKGEIKAVIVRMNPKEFLSAKKKWLGVRMNSGGLKAYKKSTGIQRGLNEKKSGHRKVPRQLEVYT